MDDVICATIGVSKKSFSVDWAVSIKNGRAGSVSYVGAMAMRPMIYLKILF